jgi:hypothetical protein
MRSENETILQRELERLRNELERTPFGTIGFNVVMHDGLISRITRTVETSERTSPEPVRHFAARGGG